MSHDDDMDHLDAFTAKTRADYVARSGLSSELPEFIKPREVLSPKSHGIGRHEKARNERILKGHTNDFFESTYAPMDDPSIMGVWEVATEVMYLNGWTEQKVLKSKSIYKQLVDLILSRYEEEGWMLNPRRAGVMQHYGLVKDKEKLSNDVWVEMAIDKRQYVYGCVRSLFEHQPRTSSRTNFNPDDPESWPRGLKVALDPALRKHPTYHPNRWRAVNFHGPTFNTLHLPWHQKILIPLVWAWGWFWSLTIGYQVMVFIFSLIFLLTIISVIF